MMNDNFVVPKQEIKSIEKLDELLLFLELSKYEQTLKDKRQEAFMIPGNEIQRQKEIKKLEELVGICLINVEKFGINRKDKEQVFQWKNACKKFLDDLTTVEYATLLQYRATAQRLDLFCNFEEGKSSFYTPEPEEYEKKHVKMIQFP